MDHAQENGFLRLTGAVMAMLLLTPLLLVLGMLSRGHRPQPSLWPRPERIGIASARGRGGPPREVAQVDRGMSCHRAAEVWTGPPGRLEVLGASQEQEWLAVLASVDQHDFHHLPGYHRLAEQRGEGTGQLFVYREENFVFALPLLLRPIEGAGGGRWSDATSVYGYAGPLASEASMPVPVVRRFQQSLRAELAGRGVVAAFSRLHPLIAQRDWLGELGECLPGGQTVSIDLTLPPEEQRARYRGTTRTMISKALKSGITCRLDAEQRHLGEFAELYLENMRRVGARADYFFDRQYFENLSASLGSGLQLFVASREGEVIAGGLFTRCDGVVQYHLSGTRDAHQTLSPARLIIETARAWACAEGARVLHLGGGVGSTQDSLFAFKAGFSDRRHEFATWRWIVVPEVYAALSEERRGANAAAGLEEVAANYFPAYRCPTIAREGAVLSPNGTTLHRHG